MFCILVAGTFERKQNIAPPTLHMYASPLFNSKGANLVWSLKGKPAVRFTAGSHCSAVFVRQKAGNVLSCQYFFGIAAKESRTQPPTGLPLFWFCGI